MKRTPEERLFRAHMGIAKHPDFSVYSGLIACGESKVVDDVATACTDGWNKYYGRKFMTEALSDDKYLNFVVLHELTHQAYNHMGTWDFLHEQDPRLANLAADYFVNLTIKDVDPQESFCSMPKKDGKDIGVYDPKYRGWSVKQIFDDLKNNGGGDGDNPMDDHEWGDDKGEGGDGDDTTDQPGGYPGKPKDYKAQVEIALRQGKQLSDKLKQQGTGSAGNGLNLDALLYPKKNWRELLREFMDAHCADKDESTWRKPNRRYLADDVYMPSMQSFRPKKIAVVFDTSGSVFGSHEAKLFATEMAAIIERVKPEQVVVMYVDTSVAASQVFEDGQFHVSNMRYAGGGGTDLEVAYDWLEKNNHGDTQCCVVLTDGFLPFTTAPKFPVIWAMSTEIKAPYGMTIKIGE